MAETTNTLIPMYGFLQGDTLGILILAHEQDTMTVLADRLQRAASSRIATRSQMRIFHNGKELPCDTTVKSAGMTPLCVFHAEKAAYNDMA